MDDLGIDLDPDGEFSLGVQFTSYTALLNVGHDNVPEQGNVSHEPIDWDSVLLAPITEDQSDAAHPVMDEDAVYEFVGLRAEDERAEQARMAARKVAEIDLDNVEKQDADLLVHDNVPGEDSVLFDKDDPPMEVGTVYSSMNELRDAVRQHAIKRQFKLDTKKSRPDYFLAKCAHEECSWSISARKIHGDQQVKIAVNKGKHFCPSTKELITKTASYKWVRDKAIPILRKDPNIQATKLKKELFEQHQVTIGYSTVHLGKEMTRQELFGTWEESFGLLFNFAAEIEKRMPGSVVEVEVVNTDEGHFFHRFFCCMKPSIDGFLNGCRPFLSVDSTALNGRWNGHLASATALDGHNWIFPVAFGFFDGETNVNWTWFMKMLQKAIGNPPHLAISSDACKGIENAVKEVFPWAEHRECFVHLMKNFSKRFQGPAFGRMYPAARTFQPEYHEYCMQKMYEVNNEVEPWLKKHHKLKWMRSQFSEAIKCDHITNNVSEVWNNWVKEDKDLPVADLADKLRSKFMELYARRRRIGEKFEGHVMLPLVVRQLYAMTRQLGHLYPEASGRDEAQVSEVTAQNKLLRHVVNIKDHECTCREWQVSGKPCAHALSFIITQKNAKMQDYLDPYYSVDRFRVAYAGVIKPLPDKSQWMHVELGFKMMPPLDKRDVGRQWKNRIPSCLENKGSKPKGKGMWKVKCPNCLGLGYRSNSPKCPLNGTKKRKSRGKKGKAGRPPGSPSKRLKVVQQEGEGMSEINTSPGPVTSQLELTMGELGETNELTTSRRAVTLRQTGEEPSNAITTPRRSQTGQEPSNAMTPPRRSPRFKIGAVKKKLTPRKGKKKDG